MSSTVTARGACPLTLRLWRHHDAEVADLPGVAIDPQVVTAPDLAAVAADLYERGARRVELVDTVDLSGGHADGGADEDAAARGLVLVRELTSRAVLVDWTLRLADAVAGVPVLNHLHPPTTLDAPGGQGLLDEWRDSYHICKCIYRRGPGFVQVRDRRGGELSRFTIDEPDYLAALDTLSRGADVDEVPADVLDDYVAENLVWVVGRTAVWLPYRVRRWPWPSTRA